MSDPSLTFKPYIRAQAIRLEPEAAYVISPEDLSFDPDGPRLSLSSDLSDEGNEPSWTQFDPAQVFDLLEANAVLGSYQIAALPEQSSQPTVSSQAFQDLLASSGFYHSEVTLGFDWRETVGPWLTVTDALSQDSDGLQQFIEHQHPAALDRLEQSIATASPETPVRIGLLGEHPQTVHEDLSRLVFDSFAPEELPVAYESYSVSDGQLSTLAEELEELKADPPEVVLYSGLSLSYDVDTLASLVGESIGESLDLSDGNGYSSLLESEQWPEHLPERANYSRSRSIAAALEAVAESTSDADPATLVLASAGNHRFQNGELIQQVPLTINHPGEQPGIQTLSVAGTNEAQLATLNDEVDVVYPEKGLIIRVEAGSVDTDGRPQVQITNEEGEALSGAEVRSLDLDANRPLSQVVDIWLGEELSEQVAGQQEAESFRDHSLDYLEAVRSLESSLTGDELEEEIAEATEVYRQTLEGEGLLEQIFYSAKQKAYLSGQSRFELMTGSLGSNVPYLKLDPQTLVVEAIEWQAKGSSFAPAVVAGLTLQQLMD